MRYLLGLLLCVGMAGCSVSIEGDTFKQQTPEFSLEQFFTGEVKAWGIVQNRSGEVVQRFTVDISGTKDGNVLVLDERFTYSLGEGPASRIWRITPQTNGTTWFPPLEFMRTTFRASLITSATRFSESNCSHGSGASF